MGSDKLGSATGTRFILAASDANGAWQRHGVGGCRSLQIHPCWLEYGFVAESVICPMLLLCDIRYSNRMKKRGQLALPLPRRGGRRQGAGRPRTRPHPGLNGPGVPHLRRQNFSRPTPVHVTLRVGPGVGHLRGQRQVQALLGAFRAARERFGVRIIHYSIQGNHLHLIVEADDVASLAHAMQGLCIRLAKRLNALVARRGDVFADRYHSHVLGSRREVANAVRYVVGNYRHHAREQLPRDWRDALSSARFLRNAPGEYSPVTTARTWLLRVGWRDGGCESVTVTGKERPRLGVVHDLRRSPRPAARKTKRSRT